MTHQAKQVFVCGQPKGEVFKKGGRWNWRRGASGLAVEGYARGSTLDDVKTHIGRVCRSTCVEIRNAADTPDQH